MRLSFPLTLVAMAITANAADPSYFVYVGTYTGKGSQGIYAWRFDPSSGKLTDVGLVAETPNPTFLAVGPGGTHVYAVNEVGKGTVAGFSVDASTGKLQAIGTSGSGGSGPCHLTVDKSGRDLLTANYGSGSVALVRLKPDGAPGDVAVQDQHKGSGADRSRQEGPHAHSVNITPDGHFAVAADLGTDELVVYRFDAAKGELKRDDQLTVKTKPGAGPRHFTFHPNGKFAYAINELNSTVTAYSYDGKGGLREIATYPTLPSDFKGSNSTAEVVVHPNGRTLYGSNRGHDSLAVFNVDPGTGKLTFVEHVSTGGKTPRNFAIEPTGKYLFAANQDTNNVVLYKIAVDGKLTPAGPQMKVTAPVCVRFVAAK